SPLNSRQPRLLSADRPSLLAVGTPISPTPHRSAIALASKQRVVTRQLSLSLISARLPSADSANSSSPPRFHLQAPLPVIVDSTIRLEPQVLNR
ncbi:hypothetical protein HAX54_038514, partial [Datura stramonium]|nr:hypothetical protein [Datura stramonium]